MKLSGHTYSNAVFDSLLDSVCKDVVLTKEAQKAEQAPISGSDIFSSTTQDTLNSIQDDILKNIAAELQFAADRARVAVTTDDLAVFASTVTKQGLRGKKLERAAQKYCNDIHRDIAPPQSSFERPQYGELPNAHAVQSATYDVDSVNNSSTGGYMGMSKNPNSIWDTEVLRRQAQIPLGDEQIKASKKAQTEYKHQQKNAYWQEIQDSAVESNSVQNSIMNAGTSGGPIPVVSRNFPANTMSIFDNDRDFNRVPEHTVGEKIAQMATDRANKVGESRADWDKSEPAKRMNNNSILDKLFDK